MARYHQLGNIPSKRHTQFRKPDGKLYSEELISTIGFDSVYSLVYHTHIPTAVKSVGAPVSVAPEIDEDANIKSRKYFGFEVAPVDDFLESRKIMMVNSDCKIAVAAPRKSMTDYFYKNATADEVLFIHKGGGIMHSLYGDLPFVEGDYVVIPRGTIYQLEFNSENNRLLVVESTSPIITPKRYRNEFGQ